MIPPSARSIARNLAAMRGDGADGLE